MGIPEKITMDLKAAMKNKDADRVSALRLIRTEFVKREKEKGEKSLPDEAYVQVLQSMMRGMEESIEQFKKGGREDLAAREEAQLKVVHSYMPEKVSTDEIKSAIDGAIEETGALSKRDFGKVMGKVMHSLKETGKVVDGKEVKDMVNAALEKMKG